MPYQNSYKFEKKNFKNSPHKHNWDIKELAKHYRMGNIAVVKHLFPVIGRKTRKEMLDEKRRMIMGHSLFGKEGERAPCRAKELANALGVNQYYVCKLRRKAGVRPFDKKYDNVGLGLQWVGSYRSNNRHGVVAGNYQLTPAEEKVYDFIKICYNWGRPEGIDEHLEAINND